jgi:hypothetical protein
LGRNFVFFLFLFTIFGLNITQIFLYSTKFVSHPLIATHGHFHRHEFPTANYFLTRPVLSYLAVATATWQHWPLCPWSSMRLSRPCVFFCPENVFSQSPPLRI